MTNPGKEPIFNNNTVPPVDHWLVKKGCEIMNKTLTMIYWKGERFWLGKILEHPEIMTQGESREELEENLKDAYLLMVMEDVPEEYELKEIAL